MMNISTYGMLDVIFNNIDHILFVANEDAENFNLLYINDTTGILGIEKEVFYKMPFLLFKIIVPLTGNSVALSNDKKNSYMRRLVKVKSKRFG